MNRSAEVPTQGSIKQQVASLKREGILDAATKLLIKHGYHGCSMDAIASALGVTKPFIYYQFRDKAEILAAICRTGAELTRSAIEEAEHQEGTNTVRLRHFCERLASIVIRHGRYLVVYTRETGNLPEEHRHGLALLRDEIDQRVSRLIAAGEQAGEFAVEDPLLTARAITGMLSYIYIWYRETDPIPDETLSRSMAEIAMRTLSGPSQQRSRPKPGKRRKA